MEYRGRNRISRLYLMRDDNLESEGRKEKAVRRKRKRNAASRTLGRR